MPDFVPVDHDPFAAGLPQLVPVEHDPFATHGAVADFFRSIPGGVVGGIGNVLSASGQAAQAEMAQPIDVPNAQQTTAALQKNVTGQLPQPEGRAGKFGAAIGETLANPISYIGPGGLPFKIGAAALAAVGGEGGRQAAEGTPYEIPALIAGSLAGGAAGIKALGPKAPKAAIPTAAELRQSADVGYETARNAGLELQPRAISNLASSIEQELSGPKYGFSPKVADKTFAVLDELQHPPAGSSVSGANLDALRQNLRHIASELQPAPVPGGVGRPTPDAAAASIVADRLAKYMESVPSSHVMAGNAADYVRAVKQANGDYAAAQRVRDFDARLTKAENATDRQIAGSLDSQIKSKAGQMLDNPVKLRGLTDAEKAQLQLINSGGTVSNTLRQLGRGGAGVVPMMGHLITGAATGGASIPYSLGIGVPLYAARKASEAITKGRAGTLSEMLAKRSPEYQRRVAGLPAFDNTPNIAATIRSLMLGLPGQ